MDGLAVERGGRRVVEGLSFALGPGEALAVVGRNGAGKSTLLRAVSGLLPAAAGTITLTPWDAPRRSAIHLVAHLNAVKLALTAEANVAFMARLLGEGASDDRVADSLDAVGLLALGESPARLLSQGQRRRLALARLVAAPRPMWLLDEPTAGLDAASRDAFGRLAQRHLAEGGLIVAATHEPLPFASRTLHLDAS